MKVFNKKKTTEAPISNRQVSVISSSDKNIFVNNTKTINILREIIQAPTAIDAINVIVNKTPDGKQALNTYLRLANQGINIELHSATTGRTVKRYDTELRDFCKDIAHNNASGLDGLVDQLHASAITRRGMAVEVVVNDDITDVEEVVIVDPATITEFEWIPGKKRYAAYQNQMGKRVDLFEGNFFWVPHQPKPGRPDGTLQFEPAIATLTEFYQLIQDSMVVLNRIGYPRYKCTIDRASLLESVPPSDKATPELQAKLFESVFNQIESQMIKMGKDKDIITFDSNNIEILGGGVNGSGIDVRAWFEVLEPLICNAFQLTPVLMGRLKSGSYSLGTAEYSIVCDTIDTMRRGSKRIIEDIVNLWARVKGYNVRATVTHNPIDWQTEIDKLNSELKSMEKARRAEEYRWISHDEAAQMGIGADGATVAEQEDMFEFLKRQSEPTEPDSSEDDIDSTESEEVIESIKDAVVKNALDKMGLGDAH